MPNPQRTPTPDESTVTIHFDEDQNALVEFPYWGVSHSVYLGPNPTWPTMAEVNDMVADAVRLVLDHACYAASGMKIERDR